MAPLSIKFYVQRISILFLVCCYTFCAGWISKDIVVKLFLGDQNFGRTVVATEEPPVVIELTPAQKEFWAYLEQFNQLPENPTEEMEAVYTTKGIAPEFHYLKTSKKTVLGDIKGLTAHRERFIKRYPWVQPLLDQYEIEIPISEERFSGTIEEIWEKYQIFMRASKRAPEAPEKEKNYVTNYLEGLLLVDFVYACGTDKDKRDSMKIVGSVFSANYLFGPLRKKLEISFMSQASRDIGWAIIADYPKLIWGDIPNNVAQGFFEYHPVNKIDFYKWIICTKEIPNMDDPYERNIYRGLIHNEQVKIGMLSYSIYSAHSHEVGRPPDAPWLIVIQILFKRVYPKDHANRHKEYLTLLNAAYPKIES